jgi:outer membrane receptor protein involved in Fe transport
VGKVFIAMAATALACPALAQQTPASQDNPARNDDIIVYGRGVEQIGIAQSGSQGVVGYRDFEDRAISRVGELVENVPGVIATQHSGTGKANQYFLRGFNLDHGTDFAGFIDGVPINMRSHGHGQGYLDLNFIIPELIQRIDYRKGPYFADVGDFSAAGTVAFRTYETLKPIAEAQVGQYGYYRALLAGSTRLGSGDLLLGGEATFSDGPWALDEDLRKFNAFAKYSMLVSGGRVALSLSAYDATWNATDQVPERAIASGLIDRFGNIDPTLDGKTTRIGGNLEADFGATRANAFATWYDFRLISNFTYFLDDPVDGDQFQQADRRVVLGGSASHAIAAKLGAMPLTLRVGGDTRYDAIDRVGLYRSVRGEISSTVRQDQVDEFSVGGYVQAELAFTPRLRAVLGLRGDYYDYSVDAELAVNAGKGSDAILGPKAALAWRPVDAVEFYANYGESFHSNDVRGATITIDPVTGDPADQVEVLSRGRGAELGARYERGTLIASLVGFYLKLDSELVFVGDAGTTEPNNASRRYGGEATIFWRPTDQLTFDLSAAATDAKFLDTAPEQDFIPGAVSNVVAAGATIDLPSGLSGSIRVRHFGSAPLIEDGSVRSDGTTLVNLGGYFRTGKLRLGIDLFNVFDARDADITYFYASRLLGEPADGFEDRHIHPVEPRQVRGSIRYSW